jgi:hypothetical protein
MYASKTLNSTKELLCLKITQGVAFLPEYFQVSGETELNQSKFWAKIVKGWIQIIQNSQKFDEKRKKWLKAVKYWVRIVNKSEV